MQALLAEAQAAAGDPLAASATLREALATAGSGERLALTVALANQEWWLGGHEPARRRLHRSLAPALSLRRGGRWPAAGDRQAARAALLEAESALDAFGALRRRSEAARELRRLGHRVLRPAHDASPGPLGPLAALTAREREIAELIADGRTNREVAEQLVLSPRTIEAHLRNIFGKLGVRSRMEHSRELQRL